MDESDARFYTMAGLQQLSQLTALRHLALRRDILGAFRHKPGALAFLPCLAELQHLDVDGSYIGTAALAHIAQLTYLTHLDVGRCNVNSTAPLARLTALRHLNCVSEQVIHYLNLLYK